MTNHALNSEQRGRASVLLDQMYDDDSAIEKLGYEVIWLRDRFDEQADEITALRAAHEALLRRTQSLETALDQERAKVRELAESPPMASISLCCGIVRPGRYDEGAMHNGLCRSRHGGELGRTYYLHDVSALLSGRGEKESPH